MEIKEIKNMILSLIEEINDIKKVVDFISKKEELSKLELEVNSEEFWKNDNFQTIMSLYNNLKELVHNIEDLDLRLTSSMEMLDIINEDETLIIEEELESIKKIIEKLKIESMLSGEFDNSNAYIEIHSGAGGTESNDWANMISRMYQRYFDKKGFKYEVIDKQDGEEVGIKGILLYVKGVHSFGLLKGETGVHRLVRISPFDSNKRRHTSFASVLVTPEIDKTIEVDIKENDLKIDVYHSGGAGGQSVNTTDSAVRMTHLPTGIVVTCQNERSQLKNKEKALEILKSRLYILEKEKLNKEIKELKGEVMDVNFGSAIRSYVMCPYTLVKDTRTNAETSDVKSVLDGEIDLFIESFLKSKSTN